MFAFLIVAASLGELVTGSGRVDLTYGSTGLLTKRGNQSVRLNVESPLTVELSGTLDTEAGTVTFNPVAGGYEFVSASDSVVYWDYIPGIPEQCNLSGCTPEVPPRYFETPVDFYVEWLPGDFTLDESTLRIGDVTRDAVEVHQRIGSTADSFLQWTLISPGDGTQGAFELGGGYSIYVHRLNLERNESGRVVGWQPEITFNRPGSPRLPSADVMLDGSPMTVSVPEPSSVAFMAIAGVLFVFKRLVKG